MSTPNRRGPAKGQGGRPIGSTKAVARTERLNDRLLSGTVRGLRRKAGATPLFEFLATIAEVTTINSENQYEGWLPAGQHAPLRKANATVEGPPTQISTEENQ